MPWFKVDDNLAFHQKTLRAGNSAMGLWVRAGSWCAQQLTDGYVPADIARTLGSKKDAKCLVDANLWLERDGGYEFWQWNEEGRQPTRSEVEVKRKEARERQAKARERRLAALAASRGESQRDSTSDSPSDSAGSNGGSHASPDPTRPDPTRPEVSKETSKNTHSAKPSTPDLFEEFWAVFPKKVAKTAARRRWDTLVKRGTDQAAIIAGAKAYAAQVRGTEPQFIKQPDGWLNAGRWEDEPAGTVQPQQRRPGDFSHIRASTDY